jgi:phosphatidyl-myo-inositol dimannoside synthase
MKILLISSQDYLHHRVISRHHNIFEEMSKHQDIHVAHFHVSRGDERETNLKVEECTLIPFTSPILHYTFNALYHSYIFNKIIKENSIDAVVIANILAGTAAILAAHKNNKKVILDLKDWFPDSAAAYFKNRLMRVIVHRVVLAITLYNLRHSDSITTVSPSLVEKLKSYGFKSTLITNGVNTDIFKPMSIDRKLLGLPENDIIIGFVGSIERWYNIRSIILSMEELNRYNDNITFLIVGESLFTDYELELKQLVNKLHIEDKVLFFGSKSYKELPEYINSMDICLIPLEPPQWRDIALPNKYFEYTACGKPILMTHMRDVESICGDNVFTYSDTEEYIEQMKYIMYIKPKFDIDIKKDSWVNKSHEMEMIISQIVYGAK